MSNILKITTFKEERATLRILGIIERRGFDVVSLNLPETKTEYQEMWVQVKNRYDSFSTETLVRQLNQAHNVVRVSLETSAPQQNSPTSSKTTEMSVSPAAFSPHEVSTHSKYVETVR